MAKVRRATFFFPAIEEESANANERRFTTDFSFIFDDTLQLVVPISRDFIDSNFNPLVKVVQNASYSDSSYSIGLAINSRVIDDGILIRFPGNNVEGSFEENGRKGVVIIKDRDAVPIGEFDQIDILVKKTSVYSPWLYYGLIPQRSQLSPANIPGRHSAGMGAIYPMTNIEAIQAAGLRYFVDVFGTQGRSFLFNAMPPQFMTFAPGSPSSFNADYFFMGDFLSADGRVMSRSHTSFTVLAVGTNLEIGGVQVGAFNISRSDNFRSIDSKTLEYQEQTHRLNPSIKSAHIFIVLDAKQTLNTFYNQIESMFKSVIKEFIDFDTVIISVFHFFAGSEADVENSTDTVSISKAIGIDNIQSGPSRVDSALKGILNIIKAKRTRVFESDPNNLDRFGCIFVSDMNVLEANEQATIDAGVALLSEQFEGQNLVDGLKLAFVTGGMIPTPRDVDDNGTTRPETNTEILARLSSLGNAVFGTDNVTNVPISAGASINGMNFISLMASSIGEELDDTTGVELQSAFDVNVVKSNISLVTTDTGDTASQDFDNDGVVSIIDSRMYDLTLGFNPTRASFTKTPSFLTDEGSEMRFWRKICPLGQLFRVRGVIASGSIQTESNTLLKIELDWPDDDLTNQPVSNSLWVYVERGANTTFEDNFTGAVEIQGKLFFPSYIKKTSLSLFKFNRPSEISSWFRVFRSTAQDMLSFAEDNPDEPLLVVRSNLVPSSAGESDNAASGAISLPGGGDGPGAFYKIAQLTAEVGDYVNPPVANDDRYPLQQMTDEQKRISPGQELTLFNPSGDIVVSDIQFDVILPEDAIQSNGGGLLGDFFYHITYQARGLSGQDSIIGQFFSAVTFNGNNNTIRLKLKPMDTIRFVCKEVKTKVKSERAFEIAFPYPPFDDGSDAGPQNFIWTWNKGDWNSSFRKNNGILFDTDFVSPPDPSTGTFTIKADSFDPEKDFITAVFSNIAGNQIGIKIGRKIKIKCISGPEFSIDGGVTNERLPRIDNVSINFNTTDSIERVNAHHGSTFSGDNFYLLVPTFGFAALSGHGWELSSPEEVGRTLGGAELNGTVGNQRVQGDLVGPVLFFDAFASNTDVLPSSSRKLLRKIGDTGFPVVDIVTANVVSTLSRPFMQTLTIDFIPPPADIIPKLASTKSRLMDKITIVYKLNNALQQSYSFIEFLDQDTEDGVTRELVNKSLRRDIPIYSQAEEFSDIEFTSSSNGVTFDINNNDRVMVALSIKGSPFNSISPANEEVETYDLKASSGGTTFFPFGYRLRSNLFSSQIIPTKETSYVQVPDTSTVTRLKLEIPDGSEPRNVDKIEGGYVQSLINGDSPSIFETSFGEYILFFSRIPEGFNDALSLSELVLLISTEDGQRWKRPAVDISDPKSQEPIVLLTGYTNPYVLSANITDQYFIFAYNHLTFSIDFFILDRALILKIGEGKNEQTDIDNIPVEAITGEEVLEDPTSLVSDDGVTSYARVFRGGAGIKQALLTVSSQFSAAITPNGYIYIAAVGLGGGIRVKVNRSFGGETSTTSSEWEDLGIDLLHDDGSGSFFSKLSKVIPDVNTIQAMTLSYSSIEDVLHLFIANDNRLISIKIPESIIKPPSGSGSGGTHTFLGLPSTDDDIDRYFQESFNNITPVLVVGRKEGLEGLFPEFINVSSETSESFNAQIVSIEWSLNGDGFLYYLSNNGDVISRKSDASGERWNNFSNI